MGFPGGSAGKESTCNVGDLGSIPGLRRSPGEGRGYPLQYCGLESSMDCVVYGVAKSRTWLSDSHFHSRNCHLPRARIQWVFLIASTEHTPRQLFVNCIFCSCLGQEVLDTCFKWQDSKHFSNKKFCCVELLAHFKAICHPRIFHHSCAKFSCPAWAPTLPKRPSFSSWNCTLFGPRSLQMVTAAMKLNDACSLEGKLWPTYTAY